MPGDLPGVAWLVAVLFWSLMLVRVWRRFFRPSSTDYGSPASHNPDGPRWSSFRDRGF